MRKIMILLISSLFLVACQSDFNSSTNTHTIIDWVDFVKIDDIQYEANYSAVIADSTLIAEEIGEVTFKMDENITSSSYKAKNGDASYLDIGTKLFAVKDMPDFIMVEDDGEINGYRIYRSQEEVGDHQRQFNGTDQSDIKQMDIYKGYTHPDLVQTYTDSQEISEFMELLNAAEEKSSFTPDISAGDPDLYEIVLDTGEPIAGKESLFYDGDVWYWHPDDVAIVSDEIERFIK